MAPALFISILNIMQKTKYFIGKKASLLIIATVLLSFSLISYIGIIVSLILISVNHKKLKLVAVCALILIVLSFGAYKILPEIRVRINDTIAILSGKKPIDKVNLSTFAFYSNGFVACKSFMRNPLFGSGLGSHPLSYDRYISEVINPDNITYALNKEDASGLFLRLVSETGLLGIFIFSYFIFRFYVSRARDGYLWAMSNAIICLFVLNLLRQGNYFYNGFLLFIWLYYFTHRNAQNKPVPL
ncbi:MAG: hypothetical protein MUF05_02965 [Candidatus Omnitrophica bacterium]|nr:hypothetical protein [Candidatus Omnitrophota bacterium]